MKAKENPYRIERVDSLPFLFGNDDFPHFFETVKSHNYRGAIVGPHGAGKTTLIADLMSELQRREIDYSHCRLRDDGYFVNRKRLQNWISTTSPKSILILDSAGLLKWWQWRALNRQSKEFRGFIITTHRPGRLPTLIYCQPKLETLNSLIDQLEVDPRPSRQHLEALFEKHHGNIRNCLRELYDLANDLNP